jgi:hypothetical protein
MLLPAAACRLKDIIYGFGTNNVYVVLECLDCDLRDLLDGESALEMWQIKVCTAKQVQMQRKQQQRLSPAACC